MKTSQALADEARKRGEDRTRDQSGSSGRGSEPRHVGSLMCRFANFAPRLKTLVTRWKRGVFTVARRPGTGSVQDSRGPVVRRVGNLQTFPTASEVDCLLADYRSGVGVNELAERYGVHRATVSAHLARRGVRRRRPGLGIEESAEVVKCYQAGVSMRAIALSMGVDRKAVHRVLVAASGFVLPGAVLVAAML